MLEENRAWSCCQTFGISSKIMRALIDHPAELASSCLYYCTTKYSLRTRVTSCCWSIVVAGS
eukprot:scaffold22560_cov135-Cylindrotheca_fusiformis.AAC.16